MDSRRLEHLLAHDEVELVVDGAGLAQVELRVLEARERSPGLRRVAPAAISTTSGRGEFAYVGLGGEVRPVSEPLPLHGRVGRSGLPFRRRPMAARSSRGTSLR